MKECGIIKNLAVLVILFLVLMIFVLPALVAVLLKAVSVVAPFMSAYYHWLEKTLNIP